MDSFVAPKKRVPTRLDTPLAHGFGFDYGDLQDNRLGFISHWQRKRLRWHLLSYTISIVSWIILLTIFPLGLFFGTLTTFALLWVAAVLVLFGSFWLGQSWAVYRDLQRGRVAELISDVRQVQRVHRRRGNPFSFTPHEHSDVDYYLMIGRERFFATELQVKAFDSNRLYRIYVSPESRQILSAEVMDEAAREALIENLTLHDDHGTTTLIDLLLPAREKGKHQ